MYAVSKLAEIAYTFLVAREEVASGSNVICNALCPGYAASMLMFACLYSLHFLRTTWVCKSA